MPLLVREQRPLTEVLGELRNLLPFPLLGLDNDSMFINETDGLPANDYLARRRANRGFVPPQCASPPTALAPPCLPAAYRFWFACISRDKRPEPSQSGKLDSRIDPVVISGPDSATIVL